MAIGVSPPDDDDDACGVTIPGHMFAIPQAGKRLAEDPLRATNALDINPTLHFDCAAVIPIDTEWLSEYLSEPMDLEHLAETSPLAPAKLIEFASTILTDPSTSYQDLPATKRTKSEMAKGNSKARETLPYLRSSHAASEDSRRGFRARGTNLKGNPQMQKTARDGQKHWQNKAQELRAHALHTKTNDSCESFEEQRLMCSARNFKCQKREPPHFPADGHATGPDFTAPIRAPRGRDGRLSGLDRVLRACGMWPALP